MLRRMLWFKKFAKFFWFPGACNNMVKSNLNDYGKGQVQILIIANNA